MKKKNNLFAVISLCLAIGNIALYVFLVGMMLNLKIVGSICAVVCLAAGVLGIVGKTQVQKDETQKGKGMAITGIVLGFLGVAFSLLLVVAAVRLKDDPEFSKSFCPNEQLTTGCVRTEEKTTTCLYGGATEMTCYTELLKDGQYK